MASTLTWLDTSREEQRRMRELLNLFAETESRDELGIGQVRDAFSDLLFPGTSTLHTRARYLLIVPWCYREAERRASDGVAFAARVEHNERRLIKALKEAGETDGLIGRLAGVAVKTLPSAIYWSALGQYGIRMTDEPGASIELHAVAETDELADRADGDWSATLPPAPEGFPHHLDSLDLRRSEAAWLRDRMRLGAPGTLLAHLLLDDNRPHPDSWAAWDDPGAARVTGKAGEQLEHAELFSLAIHGAALLYNLQIAERYEGAGFTTVATPVATYEDEFAQWIDEVEAEPRWRRLDRDEFWSAVITQNVRIASNLRMRSFVDAWLDGVVSGDPRRLRRDRPWRSLVAERERSVKQAQSRLVNERLLRTWSGGSGSGRLTFRWTQVRRILLDIHDGLGADDAAS